MVGNILSVALWVAASDFRTFLASRIVGGLSEGNVQLSLAIATDISDEKQRGSTMALVGGCFSIAFTFGPALGAYLANVTTVAANPFATAAAFSLFLIVTETLYLYSSLPETHTFSSSTTSANGHAKSSTKTKTATPSTDDTQEPASQRTNSHLLLNLIHFGFILFFSGIEFSFPFLTYDLFQFDSRRNGSLLGFIGLVASILQGSLVRRLPPLLNVRLGVLSCVLAFFVLARTSSRAGLYAGATGLAVTSSTVVTGLTSLSSLEAGRDERGGKLGNHRSWGQVGRALGPLVFCSLYWWAGRELAYGIGGAGMIGVAGVVWAFLRQPEVAVGGKEGTTANGQKVEKAN